MSLIQNIIKEEKERMEELVKFYEEKISKLPKGSILVQNISGHEYAYLRYRDSGRHCTDYIGRADSEKVKELDKMIKERKEIEGLLKDAKRNYREVKKYRV